MVRRKLIITAIVVLIVLVSFKTTKIRVVGTRQAIGTVVSITVLAKNQEQGKVIINKAFDEINRLEMIFSDYKKESEVSQVNRYAAMEWVAVSDELSDAIDQAFYWHQTSGGLFDITVGSLGALWGFKSKEYGVEPSRQVIDRTVGMIGMANLKWSSKEKRIKFKHDGIKLDFGGLAKLIILKKLKQLFAEQGCSYYLVNLGGDVLAGKRGWNKKWQVGLADPARPAQAVEHLSVENTLVLTSGDYYRSYEKNGRTIHHILDPETGYSRQAVNAVSLVMPADMEQPVPSIVVFLLGPEKGMAFVEKNKQLEGMIIGDQSVYSSGFKSFVTK